jgi:hypothetical protein
LCGDTKLISNPGNSKETGSGAVFAAFATSFYLESGHGWTAELKFREERRENDAKYYLE